MLDAAIEEYARYGPDGARMDRIATNAGVNKERIYQYFGNKQELFGIVLQQELEHLAAAVPLGPREAAHLGEYAGRVFDYHQAHPHFVRLLIWEGLQAGRDITGETARGQHYATKVAALLAAQRTGALTDQVPAGYLLYAVIAVAAWWSATPQLITMLAAGIADDGPAARRQALIQMVDRLAAP